MDKHLKIVGKTSAVKEYVDGFFVSDNNGKRIKIKDISYNELLDMADEYLGDYNPGYEVREKYNIQY